MLAVGSMSHVPERLSPTLVFASAIVLEQQSAVPHDKNAVDIGLAEAVQPLDQIAKRLAPKASTFWIGDFPVRETHDSTKGARTASRNMRHHLVVGAIDSILVIKRHW